MTSCAGRGILIISEWPSSYLWPFPGQGCRFQPFVVEAFALPVISNLLLKGPGQRQIYKLRASAAAQIQSVTFTLTLSAWFLFYINLACKWRAFIAVHISFYAYFGTCVWAYLVRVFGQIWPMSLAWFGPCLWPDLACDFGLIWPMCCCLIWPVILAWFGPCFWPDFMICRSQAISNIVIPLRPSLASILFEITLSQKCVGYT